MRYIADAARDPSVGAIIIVKDDDAQYGGIGLSGTAVRRTQLACLLAMRFVSGLHLLAFFR